MYLSIADGNHYRLSPGSLVFECKRSHPPRTLGPDYCSLSGSGYDSLFEQLPWAEYARV
jgi:hypothetical protein